MPPEDDAALAITLEELLDNDEKRLRLGIQARVYCEKNLACDTVLGRLQEQFINITQVPELHTTVSVYRYQRLNKRLNVFTQFFGFFSTKKSVHSMSLVKDINTIFKLTDKVQTSRK